MSLILEEFKEAGFALSNAVYKRIYGVLTHFVGIGQDNGDYDAIFYHKEKFTVL